MTLLLSGDASLSSTLIPTIGGDVDAVDSITDLRRKLDETVDLVVVGADVDLHVALELAAGERVSSPALGVVLLRQRVTTAVLTQALRSGVREVVAVDDLPALREACARSRDVSRQVRGVGAGMDSGSALAGSARVVTVFAAKGGCGKTTVATNLAVAAAAGGARKVCLVDLDLAFGDVAIVLQLFPARTIADAVNLTGELDEAAVRSLITPHSPGLDTVVAPLEPGMAETISPALVIGLIRVLRTMYDVVVIDTPPAFTDQVLAAFDSSDLLVLLATLDIPALKNLKLALETLDLLSYPREKWLIALNRADSKVGLSQADVEKTLKASFTLEIPSSRSVSASINRGVPLMLDEPNHPVSRAIRAFVDRHVVSRVDVPQALRKDRRGMALHRRGGSS
ncbi:MAG: hypothetical protein NVSMB55_05750 [Mycobacteriales bacterium]